MPKINAQKIVDFVEPKNKNNKKNVQLPQFRRAKHSINKNSNTNYVTLRLFNEKYTHNELIERRGVCLSCRW